MPIVDRAHGTPCLPQQRRHHLVVECHLQAVLDLRGGRALHVGDQHAQHAGGIALQPEDVDITA